MMFAVTEVVQCRQGGKGFFRSRRPHGVCTDARCLHGARTVSARSKFRFFEIYSVSARTKREGFEPVRTFFGQEGGVNFCDFFCKLLHTNWT